MHPVVGAGVRDFSDFRTDPWGRLERTLASLQVQLFGGSRAIEEAGRLRALHRNIRGTGFGGERYSALNRGAFAWVHLSNFDTLLCFHRWFGRKLNRDERERTYREWRQAGLVLGIRSADMPLDLASLREYATDMMTNTLEDNETAHAVLDSLRLSEVAAPPWPYFPEPLWRLLRPAGRQVLRDTTIGTLPIAVREKLGLQWGSADRARLRGLALLVRSGSPAVPQRLLQYPMAYRAQREAHGARMAS
jgi:uncharacterized protein (DUF2236 family)